ncbi:hypothetical protein WME90_41280 [Sorangium sp. So ce375]|uniref:hypothetical protein n=1 Tax=Sorangium sp. So ce375 TaxID=3133306 RepID=UPI003F5BDE71
MLARHRPSFLALSLLLPAVFTGCVVTTADTDNDVEQTSGPGVTHGSTTSGGDGGHDGSTTSGGDGGQGGSTTGGGDGGQGGGDACIEASDGNLTVDDCEDLNIAPAQGATSQCGPNRNEEPSGYALCKRGFAIFAPGHAADLVDCLSDIGVQNACDEDPPQQCVSRIYLNACPDQAVAICNVISGSCDAGTFDAASCAKDMNPINTATQEDVVECMNNNLDVTCQQAYDTCFGEVLYF